ncbi:MAG TPA: hypothetical protein PLK97_11245, partial [Pseudomonadales bacterium]|nr:hypothetical protein [Pseudomonadales bacterium]
MLTLLLATASHAETRYVTDQWRFELRSGIRLNTRLQQAHWDEAARRWQVLASDGSRHAARFVVMATGPLSTPHRPAFEGL